jgi:hypothetical protein
MKNPVCNLILSTGIFMVFVIAMQGPFFVSNNHYTPADSYVQPSCTDFTRWVINPAQYQNNEDSCHGLGLIPAPVDRSGVACKNTVGAWQSKIIVPVIGKTRFVCC